MTDSSFSFQWSAMNWERFGLVMRWASGSMTSVLMSTSLMTSGGKVVMIVSFESGTAEFPEFTRSVG